MKAKKITSLILLSAILSSAVLSGCSGREYTLNQQPDSSQTVSSAESTVSQSESTADSANSLTLPENGGFTSVTYNFSEDKYKTYYEIFPYSFYDSNGDGIGDLNGITQKLDYLNDGDTSTTDDLGVEGIWLMPIMQSPSYHKYNVTDYMTIDKDYGTNDDFKHLLEEAHKRHIDVIIDFVVNHTSRTHEWYQKAIEELKAGKTDGYADYYHFEKGHNESGWGETGVDDWYYECQFDGDMPDLNLKSEKLRGELQDIMKYWLDLGVDGFRLDAVWWYESEVGEESSIEDLKWLYDYAKSVKEDVYVVGECWMDSSVIAKFYKSGIDSLFNFDMQGASGRVSSAVKSQNALSFTQYLQRWQETIRENNPNAIDTPFISNHDTARSEGFILTNTGKRLAAALYILAPGNSFIYYGEEIEMSGSESDPDKRTGMYWSASDKTGYVEKIPGAKNTKVPEKAVDELLKDENSLLNFYKRVIALKNQNPEIARGTLTAVDLGENTVSGYVSEYDGSKVMVIYNLSDKACDVEVPESTFKINEVRGYLDANAEEASSGSSIDDFFNIGTESKADEQSQDGGDDKGEISVSGQNVKLPANTVIVLK